MQTLDPDPGPLLPPRNGCFDEPLPDSSTENVGSRSQESIERLYSYSASLDNATSLENIIVDFQGGRDFHKDNFRNVLTRFLLLCVCF